jgi:outer membrane protein OmpA-like peptidoglycan-associated protein
LALSADHASVTLMFGTRVFICLLDRQQMNPFQGKGIAMRRMIHNTTAIVACLSLLVPPLAQAQGAPAEGEQPPVPPAQEQPAEAQAEPAAEPAAEAPAEAAPEAAEAPVEEPAPEAAEAPVEEPQPAAEPAEAPAEPEAPAPVEEAPEPQAEPAEAAEPAAAPEPQEAAQEAEPEEAQAQPEAAERPAPAEREQQEERPVQAERPADSEGKSQRAEDRAERQAEQEQSTAAGQAERPVEAAREQNGERPAAAEAARQQDEERPADAAAAREQQADRPEPAPADAEAPQAEGGDPLGEALQAEHQGEQSAPAAGEEPAQAEAEADAAPATPDENTLRDALAREQAESDATTGEQAADQPAQAAPEAAPEVNAPATEGAQQAAQETGASTAAALNDDQEGEVVEQQITEENSRSSSEDFATSLRDALAPQGEQPATRAEDDDDDNNDLAKALLLGLGAVAVGSYLNNNRQVALSAPDRVVVTRADGSQEVIKDEVALLRQPGSTVATENFDDGSSRTVVTRADGSRVVTIRDADLRVLRRTLVSPDGTQTRLIDDTAEVEPVDLATLPAPAPVTAIGVSQDEAALREALQRQVNIDRRFTLGQVRSIPQVRALVPPVTIDAITFDTGSAAISPDQAKQLSTLGSVIQDAVAQNPQEMFLIEGHTDTVGADAANLALSDRRAESVALALSEYFQVPPENLVVQGYGEQFLQVRQEGDVRENRRAAVRRITDLLQTAQAQ